MRGAGVVAFDVAVLLRRAIFIPMPQTLSEIKGLLRSQGLRPKKRLGQHFLHDGRKMTAIVTAAQVAPGDLVLEIGPGTGSLSESLLEAGARLIAVEIDHGLAPILRPLQARFPDAMTLIYTDVLSSKHEINKDVLNALSHCEAPSFKLIANLPYQVASPLLPNLFITRPDLVMAVVTVQREVAQRLTASPGKKDYGPLGIMMAALCHVRQIERLSPGCFWPQPKVDSVVLQLMRRKEPLTNRPQALANLLQRLFSKRRKQLGTILGRTGSLPAGIRATDRPEQLSVTQIVTLADHIG